MKLIKMSVLVIAALILAACSQEPEQESKQDSGADTNQLQIPEQVSAVEYPETRKGKVVDTYFDQQVSDPYRWLEDDMSDETKAWVKTQNNTTFGYLEQISYRDDLRKRLTELWNYERFGRPYVRGDYTYYSRNDGLQNQSVLYRQQDDGEPEVFLDPNTFSEDGTTSLSSISFSRDGKLAAYSISEGGSDWRKIIVINTVTMAIIGEPLVDVKFSQISWRGNEGFYYSSYEKPEGSELSAKTDQHILFYHTVGTNQSEDKVIFGAVAEQKRRYVSGKVTEDDRYLLIEAAQSTSGNELYLVDLEADNSALVTIQGDANGDTSIQDSRGDTLYLLTNRNSPNQKLVKVDVKMPTEVNWVDVIPEQKNVLSLSKGGGYFIAEYMVDAISKVFLYDYDGNQVQEIKLPGDGSVSSFAGRNIDKTLYFTYADYKIPTSVYSLNLDSKTIQEFRKPNMVFNPDEYVSNQVFYSSKDGTRVPMIITHKKGLELNGKNPTMLYGYGGFNVSRTPRFRVTTALWLEQGGIYAVPNIRGGGEYGKAWHKAGIKTQKQNVFDDFIAAAEYLISEGYTSSDYLALSGGSNGGLLVGAVMTQRPDLMRVALPAVGVLDMLRYHTFTAGAGWAYDYGTAEDSLEMFDYLKGYSPVHNVKPGMSYPATMVTTADHDDRVVPAHSFKFAAELQDKQAGAAPTLIRIDTNAGHGAGMPVSKRIERAADIFGFTLYNMGFESLPNQ